MAIPEGTQPAGIVAISRVVVSAAAELVAGVERAMVGDDKVRTAQRNAWDAIQADRARAQARDEMNQLVASLVANGPRNARAQRNVGSSPRSRASQASLVSTGRTSAR
jgi:hypothetical protein